MAKICVHIDVVYAGINLSIFSYFQYLLHIYTYSYKYVLYANGIRSKNWIIAMHLWYIENKIYMEVLSILSILRETYKIVKHQSDMKCFVRNVKWSEPKAKRLCTSWCVCVTKFYTWNPVKLFCMIYKFVVLKMSL